MQAHVPNVGARDECGAYRAMVFGKNRPGYNQPIHNQIKFPVPVPSERKFMQ